MSEAAVNTTATFSTGDLDGSGDDHESNTGQLQGET